jgi:hypothetical protein
MLMCATCGSRWDEHARPAAAFVRADCPLCGGALVELEGPALDDSEPVHGDVAQLLREHLLGVGA